MNYNYMRYRLEPESDDKKGILYIVSTPIGNLEDITLRAIRVLKESDMIAAENTRTSKKLLNHYGINTHLISYNQHNKKRRTKQILSLICEESKNVSLISESGTPGILDPGFYLIREAIKNRVKIVSIPGCSAILAGLVISGFPMNRFLFEGFLPTKKGRKKKIEQLSKEERTIVLFESPHRLKKSLQDIFEVFGERKIAIARELTKKFEEVLHFSLREAVEYYKNREVRGEFVLVIAGETFS